MDIRDIMIAGLFIVLLMLVYMSTMAMKLLWNGSKQAELSASVLDKANTELTLKEKKLLEYLFQIGALRAAFRKHMILRGATNEEIEMVLSQYLAVENEEKA